MGNKTKKGGFFFKKKVIIDTDKLFALLLEFRNISDEIKDDDFMDSLVQYKNLMGGFLMGDNRNDTVDDINNFINNYEIEINKKINISENAYAKIYRMNPDFIKLLKIINKIIDLGVYKYKNLLNQNIPEKILSILGCRLIDFKEIFLYNHYFNRHNAYKNTIFNGNLHDKYQDKAHQQSHHFERHNEFFHKLKEIDKKINPRNPVFDNLCVRKTARYVSDYRFKKYYDDDDENEDYSNNGEKKKGGVRKLKSYK